MEKNKGITLIALVITIIVLLILAAVSIATLVGENGILSQANRAKQRTEQAAKNETNQLIEYEKYLDNANSNEHDSEIITPTDIAKNFNDYVGKTVTGYECINNQEMEWKISHIGKDEENKDQIYLISADYIPSKYAPIGKGGKGVTTGSTDFKLVLGDGLEGIDFVGIGYIGAKDVVSNALLTPTLAKYHKWVYANQEYNDMKIVSYLLDTNIWSNFKGDKAEYAIGGPTIEMICDSYNQIHNIPIEYTIDTEYGYKLRLGTTGEYADDEIKGIDINNNVYVINETTKAAGMWIASPGGLYREALMFIAKQNGAMGSQYGGHAQFGIRPVVCLKSNVNIEKTKNELKLIESKVS